MSDLAITQVLAQIRALSVQAAGALPGGAAVDPLSSGAGSSVGTSAASTTAPQFAQLLKQGIDAVNSTQQHADALASSWERGDPGVNLAQVMVETQKASVSLQALAQVRNRLISAYQDIMNMSF